MEKLCLPALLGPTASGKTALGVEAALRFGGEVVSCDSMQIYRGLPIGTAQPGEEERAGVPHHLIGFLDPWTPFSVSDYVALAGETVARIAERGRLPFLVGGTGLYARALLRGFTFAEPARADGLREELERVYREEGIAPLYAELARLDPAAAEEIHPNNVKRVLRALEYCRLTGRPFSAQAEANREARPPYDSLCVVLDFRDRALLYGRIDARVDRMLAQGLLEEAEGFYHACRARGTPPTAAQAIGYKELFPYFAGERPLDEAVETLKRETRRFAKRQLTWFRRERDAAFLYVDDYDSPQALCTAYLRLLEAYLRGRESERLEQ